MRSIRKLFSAATHFFRGTVPPEKRLHQDFLYHDGDGWFHNEQMARFCGCMPDTQKIRIFLDDTDLQGLDGCPYIAKIGLNTDQKKSRKYCAFLYPLQGRENINDLVEWVKKKSFPEASVFTYGQVNAQGQWISGTEVRKISPAMPDRLSR